MKFILISVFAVLVSAFHLSHEEEMRARSRLQRQRRMRRQVQQRADPIINDATTRWQQPQHGQIEPIVVHGAWMPTRFQYGYAVRMPNILEGNCCLKLAERKGSFFIGSHRNFVSQLMTRCGSDANDREEIEKLKKTMGDYGSVFSRVTMGLSFRDVAEKRAAVIANFVAAHPRIIFRLMASNEQQKIAEDAAAAERAPAAAPLALRDATPVNENGYTGPHEDASSTESSDFAIKDGTPLPMEMKTFSGTEHDMIGSFDLPPPEPAVEPARGRWVWSVTDRKWSQQQS